MAAKYTIHKLDGSIVHEEPIVGMWYCGFSKGIDTKIGPYVMDGEIAQFIGSNGCNCCSDQFWDEGADEKSDMSGYDYLAEQYLSEIK